ncbi:Rho termination factor N-terminal domain-containing protein [Haploplasma modicum]|uniref:Rho termination factor N-terminal domain-containing protein n=1 Tax=Haploplasma modicum TaxID=2150 RepID=UPI00214B1CE5|nr:Rho termination factor N-terminal domain-containing protein [Haploplasma modicum]MCR1808924.1 Rho termination factor N-terminal domain-containing protein [Haploplasma modicum]
MKWIGRGLYVFVVFLIASYVMSYASFSRQLRYYEKYSQEFVEDYDYEKYMEVFMTANLVDKYLKDPIYLATSNDEKFPFEFSITQAKASQKNTEHTLLLFYFRDLGIDYKSILNDYEAFQANNMTAVVKIDIYIDDIETPASSYFNIDLTKQMPITIVEQTVVEGETMFNFVIKDEKGKQEVKNGNKINEIKLTLVDGTKKISDEETFQETLIAKIKNDDANDMIGNDTFTKVDNVLLSNNFSGVKTKYELEDNYKNLDLLGKMYPEKLSEFNKYRNKTNTILFVVIIVVTYLLYFLKPTINFVKDKNLEKMRQNRAEDVEVVQTNTEDFKGFKTSKNDDIMTLEEPVIEDELEEVVIEEKVIENIDYSTKTVAELKGIAKEMNLIGYSTLRKQELIDLIKNNL